MRPIDFRYDLLPLKDKLFRLALRITLNAQEAEDITQDTLLRVWEKREKLADVDSLEAYVLTVGRNLALDRKARAENANLSIESGEVDTPDNSPTPQETLEQEDRLQRVHRIFNSLPLPQRTAIQLRDIEGKSYREVADIMGITEANVKVTLFRARQTVREQYLRIERYGL